MKHKIYIQSSWFIWQKSRQSPNQRTGMTTFLFLNGESSTLLFFREFSNIVWAMAYAIHRFAISSHTWMDGLYVVPHGIHKIMEYVSGMIFKKSGWIFSKSRLKLSSSGILGAQGFLRVLNPFLSSKLWFKHREIQILHNENHRVQAKKTLQFKSSMF